jgi:hypothetical protein
MDEITKRDFLKERYLGKALLEDDRITNVTNFIISFDTDKANI